MKAILAFVILLLTAPCLALAQTPLTDLMVDPYPSPRYITDDLFYALGTDHTGDCPNFNADISILYCGDYRGDHEKLQYVVDLLPEAYGVTPIGNWEGYGATGLSRYFEYVFEDGRVGTLSIDADPARNYIFVRFNFEPF